MSVVMRIKNVARRFGWDIIKYHSFWDDIAKPRGFKTILDIGASDGSSAKALRARFPKAQIYSFEPLEDSYKQLVASMAGDEKFSALQVALGETQGETVIHRSASMASSSLLPMASLHKKLYPHSAAHTEETIRIERLDDALKGIHLEKPLFIKIDVQGFERSVIKGGAEIIRTADVVLIENSFTTLYEGQALFGEIHDLLRQLEFVYRGRSETHYNATTKEPIYEDSVFINQNAAN
jgi:FkbM family methyltransferase